MKTKTTVKIVGLLACGALTAGAFALNVNTPAIAYADEIPTIAMLEGASVRVPDIKMIGENATYTNNGLRFTAKINKDTYDGWVTAGYTVTQGTFIMPVEYFNETAPTAENCFTGTLKYYWNTAGKNETPVYSATATEGMKEIINVEAPVYVKDGDTGVYTINGSVTNLQDETLLHGKLIGVSYIKKVKGDTTEYIFAETDNTNARNAAFVAQAALVEKDEAFDTVEKMTAVETDYVAEYISLYQEEYDANPVATYTLETYKQNSTGYAKISETVEVEVETAADFAEVTKTVGEMKIDNYGFDTDNSANDLMATPRFDGKDTMVAYYNYTGNRFTILDFEGDDPFKGGTAYTNAWTMTSDGDWIGEGEGSVRHFPVNTNYANTRGVQWSTPMSLPFATNTFTVEFHAGDKGFGYVDGSGTGIMESLYLRVIDGNGKEYDSSHANESLIFEANETRILTFTINTEISSISKIGLIAADGVRTNTPAYLDNICAVMVDGDESKLAIEENVPTLSNNGVIEFNAELKSYALYEDQFVGATLTVQYCEGGANAWTTLDKVDGKYSFSGLSAMYNVKLTGVCNGLTIEKNFVVHNPSAGVVFMDFESAWTSFEGFTPFDSSSHNSGQSLSTEWKVSGEQSLRIQHYDGLSGRYIGGTFGTPVNLGTTVSKIGFWVNAPTGGNVCLHINTDKGNPELDVQIPVGVNYIVVDLGVTCTQIKHFLIGGAFPGGKTCYVANTIDGVIYFDDFAFFA